jgi:Asp-tRNA(Asn)/Glu-tRNA(Gln) amidotransferase A subunit family amidase
MKTVGLVALSARQVLERFADCTLTPSAYLSACLDQIDSINPKLNALTSIDIDGGIAEAARATSRWNAGLAKGATRWVADRGQRPSGY